MPATPPGGPAAQPRRSAAGRNRGMPGLLPRPLAARVRRWPEDGVGRTQRGHAVGTGESPHARAKFHELQGIDDSRNSIDELRRRAAYRPGDLDLRQDRTDQQWLGAGGQPTLQFRCASLGAQKFCQGRRIQVDHSRSRRSARTWAAKPSSKASPAAASASSGETRRSSSRVAGRTTPALTSAASGLGTMGSRCAIGRPLEVISSASPACTLASTPAMS